MEELTLRNYETFNEIPEGFLLVKENSNLMYVRIGRNAFIAREFIDSVILDCSDITYIISYRNVKNDENILTLQVKKIASTNEIEVSNKRANVNIIPLSEVLNIKGNNKTFISLEDIDEIVNFKEEFIPGKKNTII